MVHRLHLNQLLQQNRWFLQIHTVVPHNNTACLGAVLPLSSAPEGRGADGIDAMAKWVT
jgi:hypothetical protein